MWWSSPDFLSLLLLCCIRHRCLARAWLALALTIPQTGSNATHSERIVGANPERPGAATRVRRCVRSRSGRGSEARHRRDRGRGRSGRSVYFCLARLVRAEKSGVFFVSSPARRGGGLIMRTMVLVFAVLAAFFCRTAFGAATAMVSSCAPGKETTKQTLVGMLTVHVVCDRVIFEIPPRGLNPIFSSIPSLRRFRRAVTLLRRAQLWTTALSG